MIKNVRSYYDCKDEEGLGPGPYYTAYPTQPSFDKGCAVNTDIDTLSNNLEPNNRTFGEQTVYRTTNISPNVNWWPREKTLLGPTTLKRLYTEIPNYYPRQELMRPEGTMYDYDFSKFAPDGRRISYHMQAYPYTNRMVREVREYEESIPAPLLFNMTHYKTLKEGTWER